MIDFAYNFYIIAVWAVNNSKSVTQISAIEQNFRSKHTAVVVKWRKFDANLCIHSEILCTIKENSWEQ